MKIYLAASFIRFEELRGYRTFLQDLGYIVTSRWLDGEHQMEVGSMGSDPTLARQFGQEDYEDVVEAEGLVLFADPPRESTSRGGRHTEFGIALGLGKSIILIGQPENVFHWLPQVQQYDTWNDFENMLNGSGYL